MKTNNNKTINIQDMKMKILDAGDKVEDKDISVKGNVKSLHSSATIAQALRMVLCKVYCPYKRRIVPM